MRFTLSRRHLLQNSLIAAGSGVLAACGSSNKTQHNTPTPGPAIQPQNTPAPAPRTQGDNTMRIFASSGFCEDPARIQLGLDRLAQAGFSITNHAAAYRRFQRFAGSDFERIADFQDVVTGRAPTPKVFMGTRGGYGAARLLPHIDWGNLGARMREQQTLLFGFSDVTAIQLALLAQSGMPSFAGPMLYSEFAKPQPNFYTMDSFIRTTTSASTTVAVSAYQTSRVKDADGILWGGNLSVLASLAGSPYMPKIQGGILFIEDVAEQPYRIERMLQTLHLAGILKSQQAIVLGDFRMGNIRDVYDSSYDLTNVSQVIARATGVPVYTGFPFGHVANKTTFPLGTRAQLRANSAGGYQITFSDYPTLNATALNLKAGLLPPPEIVASAPAMPSSDGENATDAEF